jgi:hypothetical protein
MKDKRKTINQYRTMMRRAKTIGELQAVLDRAAAANAGDISDDFRHYKWRMEAAALTEQDWLSLLKPIKDKQVKAKVASILWWDYASHCPKIFPLMLQYNCAGVEDCEAVYAELVRIGYPEKQARRRCRPPKDSHYNPGES